MSENTAVLQERVETPIAFDALGDHLNVGPGAIGPLYAALLSQGEDPTRMKYSEDGSLVLKREQGVLALMGIAQMYQGLTGQYNETHPLLQHMERVGRVLLREVLGTDWLSSNPEDGTLFSALLEREKAA